MTSLKHAMSTRDAERRHWRLRKPPRQTPTADVNSMTTTACRGVSLKISLHLARRLPVAGTITVMIRTTMMMKDGADTTCRFSIIMRVLLLTLCLLYDDGLHSIMTRYSW